jgi:UDP-glucose 4-epimerase
MMTAFMNILVSGGAGYIGSHAVRRLLAEGYRVSVLDNMTPGRGHRAAVPKGIPFAQADLAETHRVIDFLREQKIGAVMHFAALSRVEESVEKPLLYYRNNVGGTASLLEAMEAAGVGRIIFSSTCAVYGQPERVPISETEPQNPMSPYGRTKAVVEGMLYDQASRDPGFAYANLRYFNVAGCSPDGSLGEDHKPETHLIPLVLMAAMGRRPAITIFGEDYPTPDGTCIRDYLHVEDLVDAHVVALKALSSGDRRIYNLGIGRGHSVKEVIGAARKVTGIDIPVKKGERRPGDPPQLFAEPGRILRELGWKAQTTDLGEIIETAWRWMKAHPDGYGD